MQIKPRLPMWKLKIWICWITFKTLHRCNMHNDHYLLVITKVSSKFHTWWTSRTRFLIKSFKDKSNLARFNNICLWDNPWVKFSSLQIFNRKFLKTRTFSSNRKTIWCKIWWMTITTWIKSKSRTTIGPRKSINHFVSSSHSDKLLITCTSNFIDSTITSEQYRKNITQLNAKIYERGSDIFHN